MTATNICYNFVGFRCNLPLKNRQITLNSQMMKKTAADLKAKGKEEGSTHSCLVISCQGNDAETKLLNSSTHWHWM